MFPEKRRGFSLLELLVVLLIIGLAALLTGLPILRSLKRQRLSTTSDGVVAIAQRAFTEMQQRNVMVFLRVDAAAADGSRTLELIADTNPAPAGDQTLDGADTVLQAFVVPADISLSTVAASQVETTLWSDDSTSGATPRWLGVDFLGRTINPATGRQNTGVALLTLTHKDMVSGSLTPVMKDEIRISPVFSPSRQTYRFDKATTKWVRI